MVAKAYTQDTDAGTSAINEVRLRDSQGNYVAGSGSAGYDSTGLVSLPTGFESLPKTTVTTTVGGFVTSNVDTRVTGGHTYTRTQLATNDGTNYTGGSDSGWVMS